MFGNSSLIQIKYVALNFVLYVSLVETKTDRKMNLEDYLCEVLYFKDEIW